MYAFLDLKHTCHLSVIRSFLLFCSFILLRPLLHFFLRYSLHFLHTQYQVSYIFAELQKYTNVGHSNVITSETNMDVNLPDVLCLHNIVFNCIYII